MMKKKRYSFDLRNSSLKYMKKWKIHRVCCRNVEFFEKSDHILSWSYNLRKSIFLQEFIFNNKVFKLFSEIFFWIIQPKVRFEICSRLELNNSLWLIHICIERDCRESLSFISWSHAKYFPSHWFNTTLKERWFRMTFLLC